MGEKVLVSPEEMKLARQRLAIETKLKRIDQQLARQMFEAQSDRDKSSGWKVFLTPTGAVLAAAAFGLLGTAAGKWVDNVASRKQQETTIILKASEVPQSLSTQEQDVQRARNLLWFSRAGYVSFPESFVRQLEGASLLKKDEPLPPPVVQYQSPSFSSNSSPPSDLTFFEGAMSIDADGDCSGDCSKYKNRMNDTAFVHPDTKKPLDPLTIPVVVLPVTEYKKYGIKLGDLCAVYNKANKKLASAIFGDIGARGHYGEGSVALVSQLGLSTDPRLGGAQGGIVYIVFPNSRVSQHITPELIATEGARHFIAWGGTDKLEHSLN